MIRKSFLTVCILLASQCLSAQGIAGSWLGKLKAGPQELTITLRIEKNDEGRDVCFLGSPDQGVNSIPTQIAHLSADSVNVTIPALGAVYAAKMVNDELHGTFIQRLMPFKLDMKRGEIVRKRPQTPKPPYPYKTEEVTFTNTTETAHLAGTICYPVGYQSGKRAPIVVMVTGSGQQDRDESIFDHRPFAVIADYLARNGIASLRYDDRGMGGSTGEVLTATSLHFMRDAEAAVDLLRKMKKFGKVGVLGHSEGGMIAFMMGARRSADFIVSLAGPAFSGDSISAEQTNTILRLRGMASDATAAQMREKLKHEKDVPWWTFFYEHNPGADIVKTKCPVLALNGEKDIQVCAESNLRTIERLLPKNKRNMCKVYPGLNHLFQHCQTGDINEYGKIEETISPEVLTDIANWIKTIE